MLKISAIILFFLLAFQAKVIEKLIPFTAFQKMSN